MKSLIFLLLGVFLASSEAGVFCKCKYVIVGSRVLKPGSPYKFTAEYNCKNVKSVNLKVSILKKDSRNQTLPDVLISKKIQVNTGSLQSFEIEIPMFEQNPHSVNFTVEGLGDLKLNHSHPLEIVFKYNSLLIQTDKSFYKPGQTVHYRVIGFDGDLKPYTKPINITIKNYKSDIIVQRLEETSPYGVINGSLTLSNATVLGQWSITATTEKTTKYASFKVEEYVLPKFDVNVEVPSVYIVSSSNKDQPPSGEDLHVSIKAKYTYGEGVNGVAMVIFSLLYNFNDNYPTVSRLVQLKDGKAQISIPYKDLLAILPCPSQGDSLIYRSINVTAVVTETETGVVFSKSASVTPRSQKYDLKFLSSNRNYKPGFNYSDIIQLTQIDKSLPHLSDLQLPNGTWKSIGLQITYRKKGVTSNVIKKVVLPISDQGLAHFEIPIDQSFDSISLQASFLVKDKKFIFAYKYLEAIQTRDKKPINLQLKEDRGFIYPGKATEFVLLSSEPITSFVYQIFGKNKLVINKKITGKSSTIHSFSITVTEEEALKLAPKCQIFVYHVNSKEEVVVDSINVEVKNYFANNVNLYFKTNKTKPGKDVCLFVEAAPASLISLVAVDQSVLILGSDNQITEEEIVKELKLYNRDYFSIWFPRSRSKRGAPHPIGTTTSSLSVKPEKEHVKIEGDLTMGWPTAPSASDTYELILKSGLFVLTNYYIHSDEDKKIGSVRSNGFLSAPISDNKENGFGGNGVVKVRKDFPETWIWTDVQLDKSTSKYRFTYKVPDTITSWVASAFATHPEKGLGVAKPANLTVFKPLFVSFNLPPSVIRGEQFALSYTVFNYLETDLDVTVTLKKSSSFKIGKCKYNGGISLSSDSDLVRVVKIKAGESRTLQAWVEPLELGLIPFEVSATSAAAGDAMRITLLVKPEGEQVSVTKTTFVKPTPDEPSTATLSVELPPKDILVTGSEIIQVSVFGDLLSKVTSNLDYLVSLPTGCGEQNLVNFVPAISILRYLEATKNLTPEMKKDLISKLNIGYQNQLSYKRSDGSYSAFGDRDKAGSTWLTSFVLSSFVAAKNYIHIDQTSIVKSLEWILDQQQKDGSFQEPPFSRIIHSRLQGGSGKGFALTAFVLSSLKMSERIAQDVPGLKSSIKKATLYLEKEMENYCKDPYNLAIAAGTFYLVGSSKMEEALEKLDKLAIKKDDTIHWNSTKEEEISPWFPYYGNPPTYDIETVSYVLMIRSAQKDLEKSLPLARWLIQNYGGSGGFTSTQDTVMGISSLSKFALLINDKLDLQISIEGQDQKFDLQKITKENAIVLQTVDLKPETRTIKIKATGSGFGLVQLFLRYNVVGNVTNKELNLKLKSKQDKSELKLKITTSSSKKNSTGMAVVEVGVLTGYKYASYSQMDQIKKVEDAGNKIFFYIDDLTSEKLTFEVTLNKILAANHIKPSYVTVYKYYQPKIRTTVNYSCTSYNNWVIMCPRCCEL